MVNRVVLVGRLVKDPELRKTSSDVSFATFTLAVDNRIREQDGTRGTIFIDCRVFRDQAENLVKSTRKGSKVAVDGSLNQRNFERRDGTKGKVIEIVVDSVTFLDPNPNRENNAVEEPKFDDIQAPANSNLDSIDLPDDDLPF
ncbi:MAG: single-stranded DNA-binding protein [Bacilli bacterium]|nr:single-stranded DNA-binding protein [Bacilli bacterium]